MVSKCFICKSEDDTKFLAKQFGKIIKKGDVFALYGTLGVGKSAFSRYLIQSLCPTVEVPSPTFTLLQTYELDDFEIYHYDMYRLKSPDDAYELGIEEAFYDGVCLIEWPEKISCLLPRNCWKVNITVVNGERHFLIEVNDDEKINRLEKINYD